MVLITLSQFWHFRIWHYNPKVWNPHLTWVLRMREDQALRTDKEICFFVWKWSCLCDLPFGIRSYELFYKSFLCINVIYVQLLFLGPQIWDLWISVMVFPKQESNDPSHLFTDTIRNVKHLVFLLKKKYKMSISYWGISCYKLSIVF
jgi:hypothetical protein